MVDAEDRLARRSKGHKQGRWQPDQVDLWCQDWAVQRRKILGIITGEKLEPRERLGKLRSTLGQIRDDKEGASQNRRVDESGRFPQNFPEVYVGTSLLIHRAWVSMRGDWRQVMDAHYVHREIAPKVKAGELRISLSQYWLNLNCLKAYLAGYIAPERPSGSEEMSLDTIQP